MGQKGKVPSLLIPYLIRMETGPKGQLLLYFTFVCTTAGGILVPRPGIEPLPPAVEAQSPSKAPDHQGIPFFPPHGSTFKTIPV